MIMCSGVLGERRELRQYNPKGDRNEIVKRIWRVPATVKRGVNYYSLPEAEGRLPKRLVKDRSQTKDIESRRDFLDLS